MTSLSIIVLLLGCILFHGVLSVPLAPALSTVSVSVTIGPSTPAPTLETSTVWPSECPRLPCPYTGFCKYGTYPTFYDYHGVRCRGCDQCSPPPPS